MVQPDLLVVCDKSKIDNKGIIGAPDLIIEIHSTSSASHDAIRKFMFDKIPILVKFLMRDVHIREFHYALF